MIEVTNLSKHYRINSGDVFALRDVNLSVAKGEFLAIVGTSGSGKTTLMNILGCLDKPTSGSYRLDDMDVLSLKSFQLADIRNRKIGFIFQGFNLLEKMTAIENVELPLMYAGIPHKRRREISMSALSEVGLSERLHHKPTQLSGGQQQRVAIARAITRKPSIILADEPTGNLDSKSGSDILRILSDLHKQGTTIVLITHDPAIAKRADRIIEISDGKMLS
ncbi:MAG: ABC transporter ATP-binding protein [Ruminococcaceae bacterium]|nr:ABC transporter ATP-binding protein [Oscillospiraceae bacterium]